MGRYLENLGKVPFLLAKIRNGEFCVVSIFFVLFCENLLVIVAWEWLFFFEKRSIESSMFDFPSSCIARFESNPHWTTQVRNPRVPTRMEHWRKPLLNTGCSVRILIMAHHFSHTTWVKQIKKHPLKTQTTKVLFHFSIGFKEVSYLSSASVKTPGKKLPHRSLTGQDEINEMKEKVLRPSFYFHPPTNISLWLVNLPLNVTTLPEIAGLIKCLWRGPLHFGHISVTSRVRFPRGWSLPWFPGRHPGNLHPEVNSRCFWGPVIPNFRRPWMSSGNVQTGCRP